MIHPLQFLVIPTFLEKSLIAFSLIILFINIPQLSLGQNSPVTTGNEDFTEYVNPYAGIKLSYPSNWLAPISRDETCPCYITANLPGGKFLIGAMPVDSPNINQSCKCQSLTEYLSWELNDVQSHFDKFTYPSGISAGDKAPFELILTFASVPISEIDHYKLSASYQ